MTLLEVRNLHLRLKSDDQWKPILKGISFSLQKGETIGIVGESGSGKSVTALSIMKLIPEKIAQWEKGSIRYYDQDLEKDHEIISSPDSEVRKLRGKRLL